MLLQNQKSVRNEKNKLKNNEYLLSTNQTTNIVFGKHMVSGQFSFLRVIGILTWNLIS